MICSFSVVTFFGFVCSVHLWHSSLFNASRLKRIHKPFCGHWSSAVHELNACGSLSCSQKTEKKSRQLYFHFSSCHSNGSSTDCEFVWADPCSTGLTVHWYHCIQESHRVSDSAKGPVSRPNLASQVEQIMHSPLWLLFSRHMLRLSETLLLHL